MESPNFSSGRVGTDSALVQRGARLLSGPSGLYWSGLGSWWRSELENDRAYETVVAPLLFDVFTPQAHELYLDLGCGEGRVMRAVRERGGAAIGLDINEDLVSDVEGTVVAALPNIPLRSDTVDGVYSVLVLEHVEDHPTFFRESMRVTRPGGVLALVANHPTWTAPDSSPVSDRDGEVLWRPGDYFGTGASGIPVDGTEILFHHRSMSALLNSAANEGWRLEQMVERPHHDVAEQGGIPRLLACRWRKP